jgi:acyl dehydratase
VSVRFEDVAVGTEIPRYEKVVTRDASGDHNPLHQDDDAAWAVGFPGIIAHGMFTMAHLASCLVRWLGDPAALRRLRAQFRVPVFMDETIVAGGTVRALDPQTRRATLEVWVCVERGGATEYPIKRSEAEVQLA